MFLFVYLTKRLTERERLIMDNFCESIHSCTEIVDNGQVMRVSIEYEGKVWDDASSEEYADTRLVKQQPIPRDLEIPIKIIEEGLLKAHGIAGPDDGSTAFKYEICLYEPRDKEHELLADERRLIEKTEQEV
ncbi:hypothetical protein FOXB_08314 [Fusarium oxysporum f. sp. conglutinans Fo5176]|uniref:Uncharacterized protein n=2 Tax=Fusarium oxysporum TaxID=5507 RepID=F9FPI4_FUSOF|nr:hypothetical protein FOXB_08314 [Fusarium oxysporum f. sp. conglutinans Fo5176]